MGVEVQQSRIGDRAGEVRAAMVAREAGETVGRLGERERDEGVL